MTNYESRPNKEEKPNASASQYRERFNQLVVDGEHRDASDALFEMAQPLLEVPPEDEQVVTNLINPDSGEPQEVRLPFTGDEIMAIGKASLAHDKLCYKAAEMSGAAREYTGGSMFFPRAAHQLQARDASVWGIMTAALSAEEILVTCKDSAWEPQGEELEWLTSVRDLPDTLAAIRAESQDK